VCSSDLTTKGKKMKELKLLVCAMALASLALFTGCGGSDDDNNGNNNQPTGTNAPGTLASGSTITLTPSDAAPHTVTINDPTTYSATFNDGSTENGTYTYTPSGNNATLVLTPDGTGGNTGVSTINLTFNSNTDGTYTSDTVGSGTFAVTGGTATP